MNLGDKIRLTEATIEKFNVPEEVQEGVIVQLPLREGGAFVKHTNGMIYAWDNREFEVVE